MGIELPAHVRRVLRGACVAFEGLDAKIVAVDNLHITIAFLGTGLDADATARALDTVSASGGEVRLSSFGAFPSAQRASVVWVGLEDPGEVVGPLAHASWDALRTVGFEPEERPFHPHVTVARLRRPARIDLPPAPEPLMVPIRALTLFESRLGRPAPTYTVLARSELAGP